MSHWQALEPIEHARHKLQRESFQLRHALSNHPLFELDALMAVARAAAERPGDLYVDAGNIDRTDKWGMYPQPDLPAQTIIERIQEADAWMVMKHVETDPAYARILEDWAAFVRELAGPRLAPLLRKPEMLVFVTSPRRVTPFHFDAEANFLVQLRGTKDLYVWDPNDREVTTEQEREHYYSVSITAGTYKPQFADRARQFTLGPGDAVHIPTHAGHWVQNHDCISVSLSLNFELPAWLYASPHKANHLLRQLGLRPRPIGEWAVIDLVKGATVGNAFRAAKLGLRTWQRARASLSEL